MKEIYLHKSDIPKSCVDCDFRQNTYCKAQRIDDGEYVSCKQSKSHMLEGKPITCPLKCIESGELCDRNEIIIVKGKVIDEPNEWVYGQLLPNNRIFQKEKHTESKNCGVGVFEVIPETIKPIELCDREEVRKETAREILNDFMINISDYALIIDCEGFSNYMKNLVKKYYIEQVGNSDKLEDGE